MAGYFVVLAHEQKRGIGISTDYRVNQRIRVREVRLIDHTGENHGVIPTEKALDLANEAGLDLVEVAPNANPPVVRIMDYGKFAYERDKKEREARKNQKQIEIKTIQLRPATADFHRNLSVKKARGWLEGGKKVKVVFRFRSRERDYPELGRDAMKSIADDLQDISTIEQRPVMEGWSMTMMLTPNNL